MEGLPAVEKIMVPLSNHIKEGADERNIQHYNYAYEAVWKLITENERLKEFTERMAKHYEEGDLITHLEIASLAKKALKGE